MDWVLCHYLNAALGGQSLQNIQGDIAARRTTPQFRENLKEIANLIRVACRTRTNEDMHFGRVVYRGDGGLRDEYWKTLLSTREFKNSRQYDIGVRVSGFGVGALSIHQLKSNN